MYCHIFRMSLAGSGLFHLLRKAAGGVFSHGTAVGASIQLLHALEALHSIGYLHMDIKPKNAAVGRRHNNERRLLYLLDFGLSWRYRKKNVRKIFFRFFNFQHNFPIFCTGTAQKRTLTCKLPWHIFVCIDAHPHATRL